ncbi:hypothetical protein [Cystobacter fuscus]|nr:hypothetical protein [Cystobacter fuscus]
MQLALLRLAGPRLEAALLGFADMGRWQQRLEPAMTTLSSLEPGQVEAAAQVVPVLVGHLTGEFTATLETASKGAENVAKVMVFKEAIEALTLLSSLKLSLPSVPPSAPALLGMGLVVGGNGVMMGTRIVVSAEWVEMMRHLVRAGVLSLPVGSAAVRIQAGQVTPPPPGWRPLGPDDELLRTLLPDEGV